MNLSSDHYHIFFNSISVYASNIMHKEALYIVFCCGNRESSKPEKAVSRKVRLSFTLTHLLPLI